MEKGSPSYLVGLSLAELGRIEVASGQAEAGRATLRTARELLQKTLGPDHPATLEAGRTEAAAMAAR